MARPKKQKKAEDQQQQEEANPETQERLRLKNLAYSNNIISHSPAKHFTPLNPSKTVIKHHGKDILKKSQRKNRYLFSFSGVLAPISGGKIGELTDLGSKNPALYLDFPQGRMKLFGTIVYPKNRYLTLQFSRGGKNVMCEDWFDTMIVFSDACWVGKKEENPDEARLDFPKELYEGSHPEVDFKGGAGATATRRKDFKKVVPMSAEEEPLSASPVDELEAESPERHQNLIDLENSTPVRQSGRTAGRKFNFAEVSSGDDSAESVSDMSEEVNEDTAKNLKSYLDDQDPGIPERSVAKNNSEDTAQPPLSSLLNSGTNVPSRTSLVQATISTLFKKVEAKNTSGSLEKIASCKVSSEKMQRSSSKSKGKKVKMQIVVQVAEQKKVKNVTQDNKSGPKNDRRKRKSALPEVEDEDEDDIEESSSASEEIDESDDNWEA
ncbi:DNA-binding protein RHL1-like isoform X1 [Chenopodium quinoa]|uniref:DNA-binding protein RHL1-like isoform X1 n=1 Tax=Chenopodium quinoa TaxID=63459 RepID=UPI000B77762A|nr:DNA-binding protein RHL1-like isoform X1 [Chenopodium quinoa]